MKNDLVLMVTQIHVFSQMKVQIPTSDFVQDETRVLCQGIIYLCKYRHLISTTPLKIFIEMIFAGRLTYSTSGRKSMIMMMMTMMTFRAKDRKDKLLFPKDKGESKKRQGFMKQR